MRLLLICLCICLLLSCAVRKSTESSIFSTFDTEAHRGGRGLMPENTIPAMLHAIDLGINTLEMDTHITSDGEVVVAHDDYINPAFMLGADGREIPAADSKKYALYQMTYDQISKFDVGSKYYAAFPKQKKMKAAIPLLADLIDSVQAYLKKTNRKQVFYNIETKCDEPGDNITNPVPSVFVEKLMAVIRKKNITKHVVIQSFDKRTLQILHKESPDVKTAYLISNKKSFDENLKDLGFDPVVYSPEYKLVTPALVAVCHKKGIKILPWTVDTKPEMDALKKMGVDGIISDYPDLFMQ